MKFFFKCLSIFLVLSAIFTTIDRYYVNPQMNFSGSLFLGVSLSLGLTILFGWIDDVYILHRQPGVD